jgi:hypothetical protein
MVWRKPKALQWQNKHVRFLAPFRSAHRDAKRRGRVGIDWQVIAMLLNRPNWQDWDCTCISGFGDFRPCQISPQTATTPIQHHSTLSRRQASAALRRSPLPDYARPRL